MLGTVEVGLIEQRTPSLVMWTLVGSELDVQGWPYLFSIAVWVSENRRVIQNAPFGEMNSGSVCFRSVLSESYESSI